jgi:hypothetical protein
MIKFKFKLTNQETPSHYRPPAPAAGGSIDGSGWLSSNESATARMVCHLSPDRR